MKILAIAKVDPQTTLEKMQPHLDAEVKHAWKLYKDGKFREMYNCQDRRLGVVIVLECSSVDPLGPFSYFEMLFRDYEPPQPATMNA